MKGKALGVVNQKYRDGFDRVFSKGKLPECPGCKEIKDCFKKWHNVRSCMCSDCGKILLNPEHKTPEEG